MKKKQAAKKYPGMRTIRIEDADWNTLKELQKRTGATPAAHVRLAVAQYIERMTPVTVYVDTPKVEPTKTITVAVRSVKS